MRVLVSHGSRDGVVSPSEGTATARHFASGGHEVRMISFDGGHEIAGPVRDALPLFLSGQGVGSPPP
jgi:predicted esterase